MASMEDVDVDEDDAGIWMMMMMLTRMSMMTMMMTTTMLAMTIATTTMTMPIVTSKRGGVRADDGATFHNKVIQWVPSIPLSRPTLLLCDGRCQRHTTCSTEKRE
eukprot:3145866-Rhodomonas_salina.1